MCNHQLHSHLTVVMKFVTKYHFQLNLLNRNECIQNSNFSNWAGYQIVAVCIADLEKVVKCPQAEDSELQNVLKIV